MSALPAEILFSSPFFQFNVALLSLNLKGNTVLEQDDIMSDNNVLIFMGVRFS